MVDERTLQKSLFLGVSPRKRIRSQGALSPNLDRRGFPFSLCVPTPRFVAFYGIGPLSHRFKHPFPLMEFDPSTLIVSEGAFFLCIVSSMLPLFFESYQILPPSRFAPQATGPGHQRGFLPGMFKNNPRIFLYYLSSLFLLLFH